MYFLRYLTFRDRNKQAGIGRSRRNIKGSKIAKGLKLVKNLKVLNSQNEFRNTFEKPQRPN